MPRTRSTTRREGRRLARRERDRAALVRHDGLPNDAGVFRAIRAKAKRGGAVVRRSRRQDGKRRFAVPGDTMRQKQWWERYWFEIGYFGGIVAGIGFYVACFYYAARSPGPSINVLLCCAGAASGWFVGILTSPSTDAEKKDFSTYGKAISAFLSGVVLAKADSIFEQSIQANHEAGVIDLLLLRALLFGTTFIVAATVMFAGRRHPIA